METNAVFIADKDSTLLDVETRKQSPTGKCINVMIGPGDPISNIPVVMEFAHHQIHEGETHEVQSDRNGIGTGTYKYAIVVPASKYPHMVLKCQVYNGVAIINLYEGATFTGGALLTAYNRNRNSILVPATTITGGVTSEDGTLLPASFYAGSGSKASGNSRSEEEFILRAGTTYRVDLIGKISGTDAIIQFNWYEDLGV